MCSGIRAWRAQGTDSRAQAAPSATKYAEPGGRGLPRKRAPRPAPRVLSDPRPAWPSPYSPSHPAKRFWITSGRLKAGRKFLLELTDRQTDGQIHLPAEVWGWQARRCCCSGEGPSGDPTLGQAPGQTPLQIASNNSLKYVQNPSRRLLAASCTLVAVTLLFGIY